MDQNAQFLDYILTHMTKSDQGLKALYKWSTHANRQLKILGVGLTACCVALVLNRQLMAKMNKRIADLEAQVYEIRFVKENDIGDE